MISLSYIYVNFIIDKAFRLEFVIEVFNGNCYVIDPVNRLIRRHPRTVHLRSVELRECCWHSKTSIRQVFRTCPARVRLLISCMRSDALRLDGAHLAVTVDHEEQRDRGVRPQVGDCLKHAPCLVNDCPRRRRNRHVSCQAIEDECRRPYREQQVSVAF